MDIYNQIIFIHNSVVDMPDCKPVAWLQASCKYIPSNNQISMINYGYRQSTMDSHNCSSIFAHNNKIHTYSIKVQCYFNVSDAFGRIYTLAFFYSNRVRSYICLLKTPTLSSGSFVRLRFNTSWLDMPFYQRPAGVSSFTLLTCSQNVLRCNFSHKWSSQVYGCLLGIRIAPYSTCWVDSSLSERVQFPTLWQ